ncbi:MAG: hypothetical protein KAX77_05080 [Xanthomonadales bacterium]|nr:hypothetical protein [Xanthomonadales bacterium]
MKTPYEGHTFDPKAEITKHNQPYPYLVNVNTLELFPGDRVDLLDPNNPRREAGLRPIEPDEWKAKLTMSEPDFKAYLRSKTQGRDAGPVHYYQQPEPTQQEVTESFDLDDPNETVAGNLPPNVVIAKPRASLNVAMGVIRADAPEVVEVPQEPTVVPSINEALDAVEAISDKTELVTLAGEMGVDLEANASAAKIKAAVKRKLVAQHNDQLAAAGA